MDVLDLLSREGLIGRGAVATLRARAGVSPAAAVVDAGLVPDDVLADLLAREAGTVVIDLDRGTLEHDAVHLLPAELARRHLALVVALESGGRAVRVAFANPLDETAVAAVAAAVGRAVRPLVGTVGAIRRAIEREYRNDATMRIAVAPSPERGELVTESTRKVEGLWTRSGSESEQVPSTMPVHRLEQEATIEQRHEALLLALIEKGVITRADYGDALKRLLGRR